MGSDQHSTAEQGSPFPLGGGGGLQGSSLPSSSGESHRDTLGPRGKVSRMGPDRMKVFFAERDEKAQGAGLLGLVRIPGPWSHSTSLTGAPNATEMNSQMAKEGPRGAAHKSNIRLTMHMRATCM